MVEDGAPNGPQQQSPPELCPRGRKANEGERPDATERVDADCHTHLHLCRSVLTIGGLFLTSRQALATGPSARAISDLRIDAGCHGLPLKLTTWAEIVRREKPGDMASRGLVPAELSRDQKLLLDLTRHPGGVEHIKEVVVELAPLLDASWDALEAPARVTGPRDARALLAKVEANPNVVPRVKRIVRANLERLYLAPEDGVARKKRLGKPE
jgi:hypothetical protein